MLVRTSGPRVSLSILVLAMATTACAPPKDIVVGFVASLSGIDYMLGIEGRNAALLFVQELNSAGGIGGRKLALEIRDLSSDDSRAPAAAKELVDLGAAAFIGFYSSSSALKALPALQEARIPIISPTSTSTDLSGKDDVFFRTIMTSAQDPIVLGKQMRDLGQSRALFIAAAYNKPYYETYRMGLEPSTTIIGPIYYGTLKELDYGKISSLAKDPGYEAVMIVASSLDTGTIAQNLALRGLQKPLYLSGWAGNEDVITYGGGAVEGASLVHQVDVEQSKESALAVKYRAAFGIEPSYGAVETWDSMFLLVEGLRAAKGNPQRLYQALKAIREFEGTSGKIRMDSFGDATRSLYTKRIQGGRFVVTGMTD